MAQRTRVPIGVTDGAGSSGTGTVAELDYFRSDDPVSATWTPTAAAVGAGDVVGSTAPQTFTGVGQSGTVVRIVGATLSIATTTPTATAWRLHMFNATPTAIAENDPFVLASGDITKYLGYLDLGTPVDLTSTAQWAQQDGLAKPVLLVDTTIVAYLQALSGVTLEAVAHKVTLFTEPLS